MFDATFTILGNTYSLSIQEALTISIIFLIIWLLIRKPVMNLLVDLMLKFRSLK